MAFFIYEVKPFLQYCQKNGIQVAIASHSPHSEKAKKALELFEVLNYFEAPLIQIHGSFKVGSKKYHLERIKNHFSNGNKEKK